MQKLLIFSVLIISLHSWAHEGEDHSKKVKEDQVSDGPNNLLKKKYEQVNDEYLKSVKPIFKRSCFNCHGDKTSYPWYYKVPGVKQLIDYDIKESKKHLDFSKDFPFISHGTPLKDLNAIDKAVRNDSMPPFRYRVMHSDSKLSNDDIKKIGKWIKKSKEILK